jgi:hypothetical protein
MIRLTDKENWCMLMEMFMREIGTRIRLMAEANISMPMAQYTMVNGSMISSMAGVQNTGLMELTMRDNLRMETKRGRETYTLQMDQFMRESSIIMKYMEWVLINGVMGKDTVDNGKPIECMGKVT